MTHGCTDCGYGYMDECEVYEDGTCKRDRAEERYGGKKMIPNGKKMNWKGHKLVFYSEKDPCAGCFFADKDECPDCDEGYWVEAGTEGEESK